MCLANNLPTLGFLTPSLGRPALSDLQASAARIPDKVMMIVCGAPTGFFGVGSSDVHCDFRNADSLSVVRGSVQLLLSRTVRAEHSQIIALQHSYYTHQE